MMQHRLSTYIPLPNRAYAFSPRERQDLQSSFRMTAVVAHASSDGRKTSTAEQAHSGITQSRHDFRSIVCMNGTSIFSHGHVFDVMEAIFDRPMSPLEFEQTLRDGDGSRQTGDPVAHLLPPLALLLPASTDLKDLFQARPVAVAFEFRRDANGSDLQTSMSLVSGLSLLFW